MRGGGGGADVREGDCSMGGGGGEEGFKGGVGERTVWAAFEVGGRVRSAAEVGSPPIDVVGFVAVAVCCEGCTIEGREVLERGEGDAVWDGLGEEGVRGGGEEKVEVRSRVGR